MAGSWGVSKVENLRVALRRRRVITRQETSPVCRGTSVSSTSSHGRQLYNRYSTRRDGTESGEEEEELEAMGELFISEQNSFFQNF